VHSQSAQRETNTIQGETKMITGLALALGMIATTANTQPLSPPAVPPQAAPSWGVTTPFQSGFSELDGIPDTVASDQWQGESSQWQGSSSLGSEVIYDGSTGDVSFDGSEGCSCDECGCGDCKKAKAPKMEHCWAQRCDMPQHIPYYPPAHGNYYFRPYSVAQLARQQAMVVSWGGDPRNPYSNEIFRQVYAEMDTETIAAPESDATPPAISEPVLIEEVPNEEAVELDFGVTDVETEAIEVEMEAVEIEFEAAEPEATIDAVPADDLFPPAEVEDTEESPTDDAKPADESLAGDADAADNDSTDGADDLFGDDEDASDNDDLFGDDEDQS
jgi:hypothetical protein